MDTNEATPLLLKMNQLQNVYQNLTEFDGDGVEVPLKMQASKEFKAKFNELVFTLLLDCINNARKEGRKTMSEDDVPTLQDVSPAE